MILTHDGSLKDIPDQYIPGTPSYMAPELFEGVAGSESSDLYALGVTIYRMLCGSYPYGEIKPFSKPRFGAPKSILIKPPDLPARPDAAICKAIAVRQNDHYDDVLEFAFELENGAARRRSLVAGKKPLYQRNPLLFWQCLSLLLTLLLILSIAF